MKPLKQVQAFGVNFHGRTLPVGSIYGNVNGKLYYITDRKVRRIVIWNGFRWVDDMLESYPDIVSYVEKFFRFRRRSLSCNWCRHDTKAIRESAPKERKIPAPSSSCYSQKQVDGAGYNISWEREVSSREESGIPVEYVQQYPKATFRPFDGLDWSGRDGLKIDQTKCRPGKTVVIE